MARGRATSELTELFNHLLPVPTGSVLIVGTQKIAPEHLPKRLINSVPPQLWRELPPLDRTAVRKWVDFHAGDLEHRTITEPARLLSTFWPGRFMRRRMGILYISDLPSERSKNESYV